MNLGISKKNLYILHVAVVIILLWIALWNLVEHGITELEDRTQTKRWKLYLALLVFVLFMICYDPYICERL